MIRIIKRHRQLACPESPLPFFMLLLAWLPNQVFDILEFFISPSWQRSRHAAVQNHDWSSTFLLCHWK